MTVPEVRVFEYHDEAYHVWRAAGVRDAAVVHVDAHHDLSWLDDTVHLHIGNYLCQAIKDGIVREVYWVVPDGALSAPRARREIRRQLRSLRREYPRPRRPLRRVGDVWSCELVGCRVVVCDLDTLPVRSGTVLLDLDVDFLLTPGPRLDEGCPADEPWLWPRDCVARLRRTGLVPSLASIACSVEGGYTPLRWKYFGDELAARLLGAQTPGFDRLREAHRLAGTGAMDAAAQACRDAATALPNPAAAEFALASMLAQHGRMKAARAAHQAARAHDPSYATAYNCAGPAALDRGRFDAAERAFTDQLALDDGDGHARIGLAYVALHRRQWSEAETHARAAIERGVDAPDVHRVLARALQHQGRIGEAVTALQRSLRVTLGGHTPRCAIASRRLSRLPVWDAEHGRAYAALAALETRLGRLRDAIAALQLAISSGYRRPTVHVRLARLYAREHRWGAALGEAAAACAAAPSSFARAQRRFRAALTLRLEALRA